MPHAAPPLLTFAIPYYRHPHYLQKTLASLQQQSERNFKILIVDDAGPDPGAPEIIAAFRDDRITYLRNPTSLGIAGNWNRCVELVDTPLFTLLHADDELGPHYASQMLAAHARHPGVAGVYCRAQVIGPDSEPQFSFPDYVKRFLDGQGKGDVTLAGEDGVRRLMRGCFIFCPTLCYNKDALKGEIYDPKWRQVLDLEFYIRVLMAGGKWVGIAPRNYRYRRHNANQTSLLTENLERFREEFALHAEVALLADARGWREAAQTSAAAPMIRLHLLFLVALDLIRAKWPAARTKMALLRQQLR